MSDFGWAFVKSGLLTSSAPPVKSVQFNSGNEQLGGSADFTFDSNSGVLNLTGTLNVSGAINANQYNVDVVNKTVTNISADGSTKFGNSIDDTHVFTGSFDLSASNNPIRIQGLQSGAGINSNSYIALNSSYHLVLTSAAGESDGGTIGAAEDGTYNDGLFSDFTTSTAIGTAIDKFNEILKIIVPGPAPAVDRINYTNQDGLGTKLSINASSKPGDHTAVSNTGSYSDSLTTNSQYSVSTSGEDFRLGVYNGTQEITGVINYNTVEQLKTTEVNYSHDAFGNAESGSLKLYVNGALKHTLNLTASGTGNPNTGSATDLNGNGSGFFALSVTASAQDQNGSLYNIFQHRTSKYVVDPSDQRKGWNIAKVEHEFGLTTYVTNFVQWFNDTDSNSNAMAASNNTIAVAGSGAKYLSGVKYFTAANVTYNADVSNVYKHTYPTGNVLSFNQTNLNAASAASLPSIGGSEDYNKILQITQSSTNSTSTMLGTTFARSINLTHPFKSNLSSAGNSTSNPTLIYNVSNASSNLLEKFDDESFRISSGSYTTQGSVASATWSSGSHMTGSGLAGHTDGLMFFNSNLYSPKNTPVGGITNGNFSALGAGPVGNPNYSGQSGTRTFYRKIQNTTGGVIRDLKITSDKSTKINSAALTDDDNVQFYIKLPGTTGWMDISQNFTYGAIADGNGALINGASDNDQTGATSTADSDHCVTFGTASVADDEYVVVKILADADWTGYIENLTFQLGASDVFAPTEAPALDDIDLDDAAGETARLSFGTSNNITGYTNVAGGFGGMSAINSNAASVDSGDNRGVFKALEVMGGTLNEDVAASGSNYILDSFKNAYTGSLLLIVNDTTASTLSLANLNATNNLSSNTGFSVGAVDFSKTTDLIPDYTKPYRNGTYSIGTAQQRSGWNYARVIHRIGASDTLTNYVQWVVDPSGSTDNTATSNGTLARFSGDTEDYYYQSGIGYFTTNSLPTASFDFTGSNFYTNVYYSGSDGVSFPTTTNCTLNNLKIVGSGITTFNSGVTQAAMPALNNNANCETTDIAVTGNVLYNGGTSIMDDLSLFTSRAVSIKGRIKHVPNFKSDRDTNTRSSAPFMFYSGSIGSTTLTNNEYFGLETYRIVSGNYANQAALTSSSNTWNSTTHLNANNAHGDGMVTANGYLLSPLNIGDDGDTRNVTNGGTLEAPASNPDYSTLSDDIRTFYRMFRNNSGGSSIQPTITLRGDATIVAKSGDFYTGTLGENKFINVELKVPTDPSFTGDDDTSTAWADCVKPYSAGVQPTSDGVGIYGGGGSGLDQNVDSNGTSFQLQFLEKQIRSNQYFVIKISAHKDWTGYLSRISISY